MSVGTPTNTGIRARERGRPGDLNLTKPMPRYNAMLVVLRSTLYLYIHRLVASFMWTLTMFSVPMVALLELGMREHTLDDLLQQVASLARVAQNLSSSTLPETQ